jgi:hypothetical protein
MNDHRICFAAFAASLAVAVSFPYAMDIYLIGGQSNATGQGYMQNLDSSKTANLTGEFPRPFQIDQRVQFYYIKGTGLNNGKPQSTWMPLTQCSEDPIRFGPELGFGNRMMQLRPNDTIGIIKYAKSATTLRADWNPGNSQTDTMQWGAEFKWFVKAVNGGMASLTSVGKTPHIRGMLWQQGESDTGYDAYAGMLGHFIDRVRAQWNVPNMLFVYGYIDPTNPSNAVRAAERAVDRNSGTKYAKSKAFVVWSQDLELRKDDPWLPDAGLRSDALHFGTAGILELGRRMADTMTAGLGKLSAVESVAAGSECNHKFLLSARKGHSVGIMYSLSMGGPVRIDIYTLKGERAATVSEACKAPGVHTDYLPVFNRCDCAFIVRLKSGVIERAARVIVDR